MRFRFSLIFGTVVLFLLLSLQADRSLAQENKVYTMEASIAEALSKNWTIKAKKETIDQAIHKKRQARAEFLPKLSVTYGYTYLNKVRRQPAALLPVQTMVTGQDIVTGNPVVGMGMGAAAVPEQVLNSRDNYQMKLSAKQPIFTGFALISSYKLAKLGVDQSKMEVEQEKLDIALQVKEAYFGILKADKQLGVARKAVESLESHVKVAESFYKVGMIPINDLLKSQVELADARQELVKAQHASLLARANFNVVLSRDINSPVTVKDVLVFKPQKGEFEDYLRKAIKSRPEMKLLEIGIFQAEQDIRLAQSKFYPEIGVGFDYIKEGDEPDVSGSAFHESSRYEIGASLSWTFWEWGKTYYSMKEKEGVKKELIKTKKALEDSIRLELKEAVLAIEEAKKNIPTTRKAVEQAEENLRVSQERYKAQVATSTEVLDAQTLLTQARTNNFTAIYDHHLAIARLERALGRY